MNYTIHNDQLSVSFTTLGGTFTSIRSASGREYLWQGDPAFWSGQSPICFPICGSLRNESAATLDGKRFSMPRHGIVKDREFTLAEKTDASISFHLKADAAMKEKYPYDFTFEAAYRLEGNRILISYTLINEDSVKIPYTMGGHSAFRCPLDEGESYNDYLVQFEYAEQDTVPTPVAQTKLLDTENRMSIPQRGDVLPLSHELFLNDLLCYDQVKSSRVTLRHAREEKGVRVIFPDMPYLVLWSSKNGGDFLAIEPWSGTCTAENDDDIYDHKSGVAYVKPGQRGGVRFQYEILG